MGYEHSHWFDGPRNTDSIWEDRDASNHQPFAAAISIFFGILLFLFVLIASIGDPIEDTSPTPPPAVIF